MEDWPGKDRPEARLIGAVLGIIRKGMEAIVQTHPSSHGHEGVLGGVKRWKECYS